MSEIEQRDLRQDSTVEVRDKSSLAGWLALIILAILYAVLVISHWSEAYIDFGDGNYLYISSRLADGLVLYRDIMAPQPPCHLYVGSLLIRLGRALGSPLYTVRAFSLLLHLATMFFIFLIAQRIFRSVLEGVVAALLYLIIPIGFWWAQGYQSEGLLIFFLLSSFYFYVDFKPRRMVAASVLGTLAAFTNMTAVPYLFYNYLFLIFRKRRLFLYYFIPMLALGGAGILFMEHATGGQYLANVFFNQVGTFPNPQITHESVINYALGKIVNEGKDVMTWEGGYVLFGLAGLVLYLLKGDTGDRRREYVGWYAFFAVCSIVFVSKGGTMEYIFTIGEPFVILFFAYLIGRVWRGPLKRGAVFSQFEWADTSRLAAFVVLVLLILTNFFVGGFFIRKTLHQDSYELNERGIKEVREIIETHTKPGDAILSPPFYAFITGRRVVEEYSENYIWTIKYVNEVFINKEPGEGVKKALAIADALHKNRIPLVLLDLAQTGKLAPIKNAIKKYYKPLFVRGKSNIIQTLNTRIAFYVPKKKRDTARLLSLLPANNAVKGWLRNSEPHIYTADNLWEFIDGAAKHYTECGVTHCAVGNYSYSTDKEKTIEVALYMLASEEEAKNLYQSERPSEYALLSYGAEGFGDTLTTNFYKGRLYIKIRAGDISEVQKEALADFAKLISANL